MSDITKCLMCDGYEYNCKNYSFKDGDGELCVWYRIMDKDLDKLRTHEGVITFEGLDKLLHIQPLDKDRRYFVKPCQE